MESDIAHSIPVERVYSTLSSALSNDHGTRTAAEQQLRAWESDAAPGFIGSLLNVAAEVQAVPEVSPAIHGFEMCCLTNTPPGGTASAAA